MQVRIGIELVHLGCADEQVDHRGTLIGAVGVDKK
jgi:hypothetical protein